MKLPATLHHRGNHTELMLIDSGAGGCFIDHDVIKEYSLSQQTLSYPMKVKNVDGTTNNTGHITAFVRLTLTMASRTFNI